MLVDDWKQSSRELEKELGFSIDCPRCRSWNLCFKSPRQAVHVNCQQCGLKLIIMKDSLVQYSNILLPRVL